MYTTQRQTQSESRVSECTSTKEVLLHSTQALSQRQRSVHGLTARSCTNQILCAGRGFRHVCHVDSHYAQIVDSTVIASLQDFTHSNFTSYIPGGRGGPAGRVGSGQRPSNGQPARLGLASEVRRHATRCRRPCTPQHVHVTCTCTCACAQLTATAPTTRAPRRDCHMPRATDNREIAHTFTSTAHHSIGTRSRSHEPLTTHTTLTLGPWDPQPLDPGLRRGCVLPGFSSRSRWAESARPVPAPPSAISVPPPAPILSSPE